MWVMLQNEKRMVEVHGEVEAYDCVIQSRVNERWTKIGEYATSEIANEVFGQMFRVLQNGGTSFKMPREVY